MCDLSRGTFKLSGRTSLDRHESRFDADLEQGGSGTLTHQSQLSNESELMAVAVVEANVVI
jgi:hypothetical protein